VKGIAVAILAAVIAYQSSGVAVEGPHSDPAVMGPDAACTACHVPTSGFMQGAQNMRDGVCLSCHNTAGRGVSIGAGHRDYFHSPRKTGVVYAQVLFGHSMVAAPEFNPVRVKNFGDPGYGTVRRPYQSNSCMECHRPHRSDKENYLR
jgi:hypothetical protein